MTAIISTRQCWSNSRFLLLLNDNRERPLHAAAQESSEAIGDFWVLGYSCRRDH